MAGPADLNDLALDYLNACIEGLDTIPILAPGLVGSPARAFISPGPPVDDCCDQLTVYVAGIAGFPHNTENGRDATYTRENLVRMIATIKRCIPVMGDDGQPPHADLLEAAAAQENADAWALWNHIYNLVRAGLLFTLCGKVYYDGITAVQPSGGCGGFQFQVRASLDGYEESFGS